MKKQIQVLIGVALAALLVFGIVSCSNDSSNPVKPVTSVFEVANYYSSGASGADLGDSGIGVHVTQPDDSCGAGGEVVVELADGESCTVKVTFTSGATHTFAPNPITGAATHYFGTLCAHGEIDMVEVCGVTVVDDGAVDESEATALSDSQAHPPSSAS